MKCKKKKKKVKSVDCGIRFRCTHVAHIFVCSGEHYNQKHVYVERMNIMAIKRCLDYSPVKKKSSKNGICRQLNSAFLGIHSVV